jgi:hypothetical protein
MKYSRVNLSVPEDLLEEFRAYCQDQVRPVSAQIQYLMKQALDAARAKDSADSN